MDEITVDTVEFGAVLGELASFTSTSAGKELALHLEALCDIEAALEAYEHLSEVLRLFKEDSPLPLGAIEDIREKVSVRAIEGAFIPPTELHEIKLTLQALDELRSRSSSTFARSYPITSKRLASLSSYKDITSMLESIVSEKGEIKDEASPRLSQIRRGVERARRECRRVCEKHLAHDATSEGTAGVGSAEEFFTMREDRYVLALKADRRVKVPGVVHGRSRSGATVFMEPMEAVEINNRIEELKKDERVEEIEICKEATTSVVAMASEITEDIRSSAELDLVQAKVRFLEHTGGVLPELSAEGSVRLIGARHPLLVFKEKRGGPGVVPVDIELKEDTSVLVISGANAGGKTVALKTLGLVSMMAMAALPVPVLEGTRCVFFSDIFTDIGDRQNIAEDLSTFSAHLKRTGEILGAAGPRTLVLIDEIGVGTDPVEGSVLALAVLEAIKERGARVVVTTHLNLLKAHAQTEDGFENASVVFDEATHTPLFKLNYGVPGPSFALSVARNYGIPDDIIERAKAALGGDESVFVESMRKVRDLGDELKERLERVEAIEADKNRALKRLRDDREKLLEGARRRISAIAEKAAKEFDDMLKEASATTGSVSRKEVSRLKAEFMEVLSSDVHAYEPAPGDSVEIAGSHMLGTVVKVDRVKKAAEVSTGSMKVWSSWKKLAPKSVGPRRAHAPAKNLAVVEKDVELSVNVIGMRVPEAIDRVTAAIDKAHMSGVSNIEIIHGVGTGALKRAIEEHLSSNPLVKGFTSGDMLRGGAAVTVVEIE